MNTHTRTHTGRCSTARRRGALEREVRQPAGPGPRRGMRQLVWNTRAKGNGNSEQEERKRLAPTAETSFTTKLAWYASEAFGDISALFSGKESPKVDDAIEE